MTIVGAERLAEIAARWPGSPKHLLVHYMSVPNAPDWPNSNDRRLELVLAMERGLRLS
ncbi:hypothetical protein [Actinoplanes solisilvae]|uniref:hypothetical protein n=1 Tax=Actinoplanes solisilvae TaxID=2486853 RepID=UPI0013E30E6C|nr:hypothetical protein [Actinoplanes solisilvae]